jgi:zinc and cadmium transporter
MLSLIYSLLAITLISLLSIFFIAFLFNRLPSFSKYTPSLVSLAVGSLLGDAFIHILPEANNKIANINLVSLLTIAGILLFFSLEKFIQWHHCHDPEHQHHQPLVAVSFVGDSFHNFIDGAIIAASFSVDFKIGLATSLAVLIHEIPQEIGDFGIFMNQGLSLLKSLRLNLISASFSFFGALFIFLLGFQLVNLTNYILPITAGGFIYLAASDLIPELHRHQSRLSTSLLQILLVIIGVTLMFSLTILE